MSIFARIGIYGAGNVGSALLVALAEQQVSADEIVIAARDAQKAGAAVLDLASAYPEVATHTVSSSQLEGSFDVVVISAGMLPHGTITTNELLDSNVTMAVDALKDVDCKKIVVIGTPVDMLTERIGTMPQFEGSQVIGFGGELDKARTAYSLLTRGITVDDSLYVVGEHGPRAIPVYTDEEDYEAVRKEATSVLKRIVATGAARNLATGVQLARLLKALGGDEQVMCLSAPHPDYDGLSVTWPYVVNQQGLARRVPIEHMGAHATQLLQELVKVRRTSQ